MKAAVITSSDSRKPSSIVKDKIFDGKLVPQNPDSLASWANLYFAIHVVGASKKTEYAKQKDLEKFLSYFQLEIGHDNIDGWTPAVSRQFQKMLLKTKSTQTGNRLKETTVNRIMATVRHFGRWVNTQRPLIAGDPLANVKDVVFDPPAWNGLTSRQIIRIKAACEQRVKVCTKRMQNPQLEAAVIYVLLHTGLRADALSILNLDQYHHRGFHNVIRKGKRVTKKIPVPSAARKQLDLYIEESRGKKLGPLLIGRYGKRLLPQDIARICTRVAGQASAHLPDKEKFGLTPHMLRHTFLKRVADKHGVHYAQRMSGNISVREIFRYTKPSDEEIAESMEELFD